MAKQYNWFQIFTMNQNNVPDAIDAAEEDYLYLSASGIEGAGQGLFTAIPIYFQEVISLFKGEILSNEKALLRANARQDAYFINLLNGHIMDSKNTPCFAKYANDSKGINSGGFKNNACIGLNAEEEVCLIALRKIRSGEEIFCGYGKKYWVKFI